MFLNWRPSVTIQSDNIMDASLQQIASDRIKISDGKAFQSLFWSIVLCIHPDLSTPRMQQDLGSDGHTIAAKKFFACYAPESMTYDNAKTKDKIQSDYKKFCDEWLTQGQFDTWVFVTKDAIMGVPHQFIVELNANGDSIKKEHCGLEQILQLINQLDTRDLIRIFNLPASLSEVADYGKNLGILGEIFDYVFEQIDSKSVSQSWDEDSGLTELEKKLDLNFSDEELEAMKDTMKLNWNRKKWVEDFIKIEQELRPARVSALEDLVRTYLRQIKGGSALVYKQPVDRLEVIDQLALRFVDPRNSKNPDHVATAKSLILYLFEMCSFGKKSEAVTVA